MQRVRYLQKLAEMNDTGNWRNAQIPVDDSAWEEIEKCGESRGRGGGSLLTHDHSVSGSDVLLLDNRNGVVVLPT